ncbi:hypothetical protein NHG29_03210 [Aerococcaceae bacterium NML160702]|nr:hypothetical protein [Aerococcaceae bacterium NML160702]
MTNYKTIVDVYGNEVVVDLGTKKLHSFSNKDNKITYNAEIVEGGKSTGFYTDYVEQGQVTDLETKIKTFGNPIALIYAQAVEFDQSKNDPDRKIWNKLLSDVKANEEKIFTKHGDFRQRVSVKNLHLVLENAE